jgi:hypothetical protein
MFNQSIAEPRFDKIQVIEYSFILHWTQHLSHASLES